jgi:Zn ribbon nucleic-acid-binding protein
MGDRTTSYEDCPKCGGKGTFECYEALSSNMKFDECQKCGYQVHYDIDDSKGLITITRIPDNPTKKDSIKKSKLAVIGSNPTIPQKELTEQMREVLEGVYHRGNTDGLNNVYREHNIGDSVEYSLDIVNQARVEELMAMAHYCYYGSSKKGVWDKNPKHAEQKIQYPNRETCIESEYLQDRIKELKGGDK